MKNLNLRNLLDKSSVTSIEGEMLKRIKGGIKAPSCKTKCGTNTAPIM